MIGKILKASFRRPGFAIAAGLTLALGFGVNSLMFSVINAAFWAELPYGNPDRLMYVSGAAPDGQFHVSELEYRRYAREVKAFESVGAYADGSVNVRTGEATRKEPAAYITATLLPALGVSPALGRNLTDAEDNPGGPRAALLAHEYWRSAFNADRNVIGRTVSIDGQSVAIAGVMPPGFELPTGFGGQGANIMLPIRIGEPDQRNLHYLHAVARLADGVSPQAAMEETRQFARQLEAKITSLPEGFRIMMTPVREKIAGGVRTTLYLLYAMVVLLLLVACANVTALSIARTQARLRDLSIRKALGASFAKLSGLIVGELMCVYLAGGALGLLLATAGLRVIHLLPTGSLPMMQEPSIGVSVLVYSFLTIVVTGLVSSAIPVLRLRRLDAAELLSKGGRHATGGGAHGGRRALVAGQMALTFVLAVTALLTFKSLSRMNAVDPGFEATGLLTMQLSLPSQAYSDKHAVRSFYGRLLDRVRALPGVKSAGTTTHLPVADEPGDWGLRLEGREAETLPSGRSPWADWMVVSDGYHETMRITAMAGRTFSELDTADSEPVVVINETMARAYWPDGTALGQRLRMSTDIDGVYRRISGIVADTRHAGPDAEARPQMFLPASQFPAGSDAALGTMSLVIRADVALPALRDEVLALIGSMDPDVAASRVRTMEAWLADAGSLRRLSVTLSGLFAGLALALVAVGVYGLISLLTAERRREIAIRMALGANHWNIRYVFMLPTLVLAGTGIAGGLAAVSLTGGWISALLFQVSPMDPAVLGAAGATMVALALAATWLPARRAARIAPMEALRHE